MKFTLNWLKQHLETDAPLAEIAERLTMLGLEVEEIADRAKGLEAFVVGHVVEAKQHPNADRLKLCMVDNGSETVQVVCGAPNARQGMKGVFAPAGTYIPGIDTTLKAAMIRGEASNGMLCSEREMGLSDEHQGIIDLPEDAPVGQPFAALMGLDDPMIEIAITPNRQDCLGVHGIARDLAAARVGKLIPFDATPVKGAYESPIIWAIDLPAEQADACPMVVGRHFRGLKNGPSPQWLQDRLIAIGLRPISALVDITNFVTYDLGRPLHVFDAAKLELGADGALAMRMAKDGERVLALDGKDYTLDAEMVVIADRSAVHGIGGLMGGEHSGCTEATGEMFLEAALFDTVRTAATGRKLGIESDARYRFERGVDPSSALWGAEVAARLVLELCGGEASALVVAGAMPDTAHSVSLRPERVRGLGGVAVPDDEIVRILEALGYALRRNGEAFACEVPSYRMDVSGEADLVEDVLRVHGYDEIVPVPMRIETALPGAAITPAQRRVRQTRRALAARGLLEAVTYSFMEGAKAELFGDALALANPISADLDVMRPSILPNLIQAAARNADRGLGDAALFELGPQYREPGPGGQDTVAAGIRAGASGPRHYAQAPRPVDAMDAKADALGALEAAGAPVDNLLVTRAAPAWYHPGRAGALRLGNQILATFGEIHPKVLRALDAKAPVVGFEVFLDRLPARKAKGGKARPLLQPSPFQPVERDFAFVVDEGVEAGEILRAARGAEKGLIAEVSVFDVFRGEAIYEDKKSVAIAVILQPTEKTLTDAEIDAVGQKIVAAVTKATGGLLRG
ncbi:MAG TPA: phenylalanine--tRNA ligase subunit beta [Alphaproteobacteria bacterium]|nr:phenylalanine--tRNA ligase subunit beta [Alphaproteobacteria bacterium]